MRTLWYTAPLERACTVHQHDQDNHMLMPRRLVAALLAAGACGALAALAGCVSHLTRPAPFRSRPDSIVRGDLEGPFTGRVLDADTDRPVSGALVYASWRFVDGEGLGSGAPAGYREWTGSTDPQGRYFVPQLDDLPGSKPSSGRLADFHLLIYKRGYVGYRSDRRFDDLGPQTEF